MRPISEQERLPSRAHGVFARARMAKVMLILAVATALAGCWDDKRIRYRLTFTVEVDGETKSGSSVIETLFYGGGGANSPYRYYSSTKGVAPVIDLGRHGWLVAAKDFTSEHAKGCKYKAASGLLDAFKLDATVLVTLKSGKRELLEPNLPPFIWFKRDASYKEAMPVCPADFARVIGANIGLISVELELVPGAPYVKVLDLDTPWLMEMRRDQPGGAVTTASGIFKPQLSYIEQTGTER